jgi:oligoribonuclease NrnB/cAMP/cGMP phosphodiesterase (DHH superfamily)
MKKNKNKEKVINLTQERRILVTHTDLDGLGCAVVYGKCFPNAEVHFVDYDDVNEVVMQLLVDVQDVSPKPHIMITDMSVNEYVAELLDSYGRVDLVDHHGTAKWMMDKYSWAYVNTDNCATQLLHSILSHTHHLDDLEHFVSVVDNYDTWGHGTQPTEEAHKLARLARILNHERFYKRFLLITDMHLSDVEEAILQIDQEKETQYIDESIHMVEMLVDPRGYRYGLLAVDRYTSTTGNAILQHYPELEYVLMLDFRRDKASLRGRGNIDLGEMCKLVGGGGHRRAAGFPMSQSASKLFLACDPTTCEHIAARCTACMQLMEAKGHVSKADN